jgi:hypothetical protein
MRHIIAAFVALVIGFAHAQEVSAEVELQPTTVAQATTSTEEIKPLPNFLTTRQKQILTLAETTAKQDGHKHPELLQGILLQETRAGMDPTYREAKNKCYGVMQIRMAAARQVLREFPELLAKFNVDKSQLVARLIHDDAFNIAVGSKYLLIIARSGFNTIKQIALAYNQGTGGAKKKNPETFRYSVSVAKHIDSLRQL